jgi:hypothetical protein
MLKLHFRERVKILKFDSVVITIKTARTLVSCASNVYLWLHIQSFVDIIGVLVWPDQDTNASYKTLYRLD